MVRHVSRAYLAHLSEDREILLSLVPAGGMIFPLFIFADRVACCKQLQAYSTGELLRHASFSGTSMCT